MNEQPWSLIHHVRPPQVKPGERPPPLLLLLHGIGSNEDDLYGLAPYLDARFLIVSARAPLTLGPMSYGWFNIEYTTSGLVADLTQAAESYQLLLKFIDELIARYQPNGGQVYLLGFSQGAMMSLSVALSEPAKVAGVAALSGRLPAPVLEHLAAPDDLRDLPVLVTHGTLDPVIPVAFARETRARLEHLPLALTYREYPMGHEVSMESLTDIRTWLSQLLDRR